MTLPLSFHKAQPLAGLLQITVHLDGHMLFGVRLKYMRHAIVILGGGDQGDRTEPLVAQATSQVAYFRSRPSTSHL